MARRGSIEKLGLRLTPSERELILGQPVHIRDGLAGPLRAAPTRAPVMLTLDVLEELGGSVATHAYRTVDRRLRRRLEAIFSKVVDVLQSRSDDDPPTSLRIEDARTERPLAEQTVNLIEWAARMLIGAERLGIKAKAVARFPLRAAERSAVMMIPAIDEEMRKKLAAKSPRLTVGEAGGLLMAIAEAALDAPPLHALALIPAVEGLMCCLEAEVTGAMKPADEPRKPGLVYRLRITLEGVEPPIWRVVEVADCSLGELHGVIQVAMGWQDSHMHQFAVNGRRFGQRTPYKDDPDFEDEDGIHLSRIFTGRNRPRIGYEYDFGDSWQHEIRLEKTLDREPKFKYPRCIEGARACPPEDCGGIWGYGDFLEAIGDPDHEQHDEMREWIGGEFNAEEFSVAAVNREFKKLR
jgi:hypothetical protein